MCSKCRTSTGPAAKFCHETLSWNQGGDSRFCSPSHRDALIRMEKVTLIVRRASAKHPSHLIFEMIIKASLLIYLTLPRMPYLKKRKSAGMSSMTTWLLLHGCYRLIDHDSKRHPLMK